MTDVQHAALRKAHSQDSGHGAYHEGTCAVCHESQPCPTIRALDELIELRRVVAEAVAAMKQCNYAVSGLPGCITDALHRVPLTYEDERSVGERETYDAIRALVATVSTEQEGT